VEIRCSSYKTNEDVYIQLNLRNISDRIQGEREMRQLSARLLRLQDEERRRIARELHDSTAQNLSALEMNMSLLEPLLDQRGARARRLAEDTRRIAGECSRELRNISYLLHPPLIDEVGLPFAIKWFADGFAKRTGIAATVEIEDDFPRLGSDLEMPLFRVVQEAMTNIYRHSGADHAWVSLRREGRVVVMEVRDNGRGFKSGVLPNESDNPESSGGFGVGIAGMTERIANCGGKLEIEDSPLGVTISIRLLLNTSHAAH
jgi:signal transduction histidine kinase